VSSVPAYPPGLPLMMAGFQWAAGRDAVYFVVPLLGGLLVWSAFQLGRTVGGSGVGLATAVLTATAPAVLFQLMLPMSDVPVAAWWALALWLLLVERPLAAFAAGLAAGLAVLTRPNHVFYVLVPALYLLWLALRESTSVPLRRLVAFVAGVVPACLAVAAINTWVYGSPLTSGSGRLSEFYSIGTVIPNLQRYLSWMVESNTPVFLAAFLAPFLTTMAARVNHRVAPRSVLVMLLAFGAYVFASYLIFFVFEDWWYLRYVLAAYPPLFALTSLTSLTLLRRFVPRYATVAMVALLVALGWRGYHYARDRGAYAFRAGEHKYSAVGNYVARTFPKNAVFICFQYSGSIHYYSGRMTVRYDWIPPYELDGVFADLERLGYEPYILLDTAEEDEFRKRYAGTARVVALDRPPLATLLHTSPASIFAASVAENPAARFRVPDVFQ
jgi:4-amino-4-deoxy-L-arabinose transferase-like glycosyltransferase